MATAVLCCTGGSYSCPQGCAETTTARLLTFSWHLDPRHDLILQISRGSRTANPNQLPPPPWLRNKDETIFIHYLTLKNRLLGVSLCVAYVSMIFTVKYYSFQHPTRLPALASPQDRKAHNPITIPPPPPPRCQSLAITTSSKIPTYPPPATHGPDTLLSLRARLRCHFCSMILLSVLLYM